LNNDLEKILLMQKNKSYRNFTQNNKNAKRALPSRYSWRVKYNDLCAAKSWIDDCFPTQLMSSR